MKACIIQVPYSLEVHDPAGDPFWKLHGMPGGIYLELGFPAHN